MLQYSVEIITIIQISILFWLLAMSAILIVGHLWPRARGFRDKMLQQWKSSLGIALVYVLSEVIGGTDVVPFYSIVVFCQAMIGLALAYSIGYRRQ